MRDQMKKWIADFLLAFGGVLLALCAVFSCYESSAEVPQDEVFSQAILAEEIKDDYPNELAIGNIFTPEPAETHQNMTFLVEQASPATSSLFDFVTAPCPSGFTSQCWSVEPNAVRGSVRGGTPDADIVLLSNSAIVYDANATKIVKNVWVGSTEYSVSTIVSTFQLGNRPDARWSPITPPIPGSNWNDVKFEFSDGTFSPSAAPNTRNATLNKAGLLSFLDLEEFSPTQANIYPVCKAIIKAGTNITVTPDDDAHTLTIASSGGGGGGLSTVSSDASLSGTGASSSPLSVVSPVKSAKALIARPSPPTSRADLADYDENTVLRTNRPRAWYEIEVNTNWGHGIKAVISQYGATNNRGFNLVGTGKTTTAVTTIDGQTTLDKDSSPIGRIDFQAERANAPRDNAQTGTEITVLIKKSALSTEDLARSSVWMRVYNGVPSNLTDQSTIQLTKGADLVQEGIEYATYSASPGIVSQTINEYVNIGTTWSSNYADPVYFNFFTSNTPDTAEGQNQDPLDFFDEKMPVALGDNLLSLPRAPPDLSKYPVRSILRIDSPAAWYEVVGTEVRHGVRANTAPSSDDYGVSLVGLTRYGSLSNEEGSLNLTAEDSPIGRIQYGYASESDRSADIEVLIRKDALSPADQALSSIYMRVYTDVPSNLTDISTAVLTKQTDIVIGTVSYQRYTGTDTVLRTDQRFPAVAAGANNIIYFRFYTADPPDTVAGQTDNALSFMAEKTLSEFGTLTGGIDYEADEADTEKSLKVAVEETTPPMVIGQPVTQPAIFVFDTTNWEGLNSFIIQRSPFFTAPVGSITPDNENIAQVAYSLSRSLNNRYFFDFIKSLAIQKTPVQLEVWTDGVEAEYNLNYSRNYLNNTPQPPVSIIRYLSVTIPSADRVSLTDSTKSINIELVDNEEVTFPATSSDFVQATINKNGFVSIAYAFSNTTVEGQSLAAGDYLLNYNGSEEPQFLIINGRQFFLIPTSGTYYRSASTDSFFIPSQSEETRVGFNIRFMNGGYWNNTRTHLFQSVPGTTQEIKVQRVLTKGGMLDWLDIFRTSELADVNKDLTFAAEEITPGIKRDIQIDLSASGSNYTFPDPFPGILRLTFNADSSETQLLNRYSVNVPLQHGAVDNPPTTLEIGIKTFPLSYFETDSGVAVYRTPVLASADRVTSAGFITGVNIQFLNQSWAGTSGDTKALKSIDKGGMREWLDLRSFNLAVAPKEGATLPTSGVIPRELFKLTAREASHPADRLFNWTDSVSLTGVKELKLSNTDTPSAGTAAAWEIVAYPSGFTGSGSTHLAGNVALKVPVAQITSLPTQVAFYVDGADRTLLNVSQNAVSGVAGFYLITGLTFAGLDFSQNYRSNLIGGSSPTFTATFEPGLYRRGGLKEASWISFQW